MRSDLAALRLGPLLLDGSTDRTPSEVVRHLGAVQSQEHLMAPWAVGLRSGTTFDEVLADLEANDVVRTHVLRTTWHYVHLDDLAVVVAATADRVVGQVVPHVRRQGLDEAHLLAGADVVTEAVRAAPGCTRADIAARLAEAGHEITGDVLAHVVMTAELRGDVAGHRGTGGQHRYVPIQLPAVTLDVDDARAWVARTYARGHGPITPHDLAWWSSLTVRQSRSAIERAGLVPVRDVLWAVDNPEPVEPPTALLLPQFDELISYVRDSAVRADVGPLYDDVMFATGLVVVRGRLVGHWSRDLTADRVHVRVILDRAPDRPVRTAIEQAAQGYADFVGRALDVTLPTG